MVLSAQTAYNYTVTATTTQNSEDLAREVDLTERAIRNAATRQQFKALHDARIIGNPTDDVQDETKLTDTQIAYRDAFVDQGFLVTLDADTGLWSVSWEETGIEASVSIYTVRTTLTPGAISDLTIAAIDSYFDTLVPRVNTRTIFVNIGSGGDTDETDFGATTSTFYEYMVIAQQQDPTLDHSTGVRSALTGGSLGYTNSPSNIFVYKTA